MKKYSWILTLLLAFTMAFVLIGCGENSSDDGDDGQDVLDAGKAGLGNLTVPEGGGVVDAGLPSSIFEYGKDNSNNTDKIIFRSLGVDESDNPIKTGTDWDVMKNAKYLVLESVGSVRTDGFGGTNVIFQGDGNGWAWNQTSIWDDWISFSHTTTEKLYIVIDLTKVSDYTKFIAGTQGKVIVGNYDGSADTKFGLGVKAGYFAGTDLTKPATGATSIPSSDGFIIKAADVPSTWPIK